MNGKGDVELRKEQHGKKVNKVAVVALAAVIGFGALGGGAYAYKDEWTAKIQRGVDVAANYIYGDDIENAINSHNQTLKADLTQFINSTIASVTQGLQTHKQGEIDRGKAQLDAKLAEDKRRITETINNAVVQEKQEQEALTNQQINTDSAEMDAIIEAELNKIP